MSQTKMKQTKTILAKQPSAQAIERKKIINNVQTAIQFSLVLENSTIKIVGGKVVQLFKFFFSTAIYPERNFKYIMQ
jgi:hypothetical protein